MIILFYFIGLLLGACLGYSFGYYAKESRHINDGWIPVEKEFPPNAKHKGAFCSRYQVMTKYGVTEGWYNPDCESWFCLFWFVSSEFTEAHIDFDHGDVPKRVRIEKGLDIVLAWRPLPEPYHPERSDNHDGE